MPLLFMSYKRGTSAVTPLMKALTEAGYRLWYDKDDIHAGENWREAINRGVDSSAALVIGLTPAACRSRFVQHEVKRGLKQGKLLFPVQLERIDESADPQLLGLTDIQFIDFTAPDAWDKAIVRLLEDMQRHQQLWVTHHDKRQQRQNVEYTMHQRYLKKLADRVGWLNLAQISPEGGGKVLLESVYIDSPTDLAISVDVQDRHVVDWWLGGEERTPTLLQQQGWQIASLEALIGSEIEGHDGQIARYRQQYLEETLTDSFNTWNNGKRENVLTLQVQDMAAAQRRLVVLGKPGSGKSTFVKHLALCLAGSAIDGWTREAHLTDLRHWTHGTLLPIYIELRHFVNSKHFPDFPSPPTEAHLWGYVADEILGDELRDYLNDLKKDVEQGFAVLIFDGLDEVPFPEGKLRQRQAQLIALGEVLNSPRFERSRVIVASRPYAYENWALPNFTAVTLTDFEDQHRIQLAARLYHVAGLAEETARDKAQRLNQQLDQRGVDPELKDRPLFLTMMAQIFLKGDEQGLPARRGALYRQSIFLLLDQWTQGKPNAPSLVELLGDHDLQDLYQRLMALAYEVHGSYGEQQGTPEINEGLLFTHLRPLGRSVAAELIPYLSENAGVLVSPGRDAEKDVFHFAHRTFQEYLAAAQLAEACQKADSYAQVREHILSKPQLWRLPCSLVGDVLADTGRRSELWRLVADLLPDEAQALPADASAWWAVWLAGTIVMEQDLHLQTHLHRLLEQPVKDSLVKWLVGLVQTPEALYPVERVACGRALGLLDDPRKGVGVKDGLPDIDWVEIPAGKFIYQDGETLTLPTYWLSRYPITFSQFQTFVEATDYDDDRWWVGLPEEDEVYGVTYRTRDVSKQEFRFGNHPRENVAWYQAIAFCRWLSHQLWLVGIRFMVSLDEQQTAKIPTLHDYNPMNPATWLVRLPTEQEWEKAARGTDGRIYPYGNEFDPTKGNTEPTGIKQTSAVGLFPQGASPYGLQDMSGNVWEWCLNGYKYILTKIHEEEENDKSTRGGSWNSNGYNARSVYFSYNPNYRDDSLGFRVLCMSPLYDLQRWGQKQKKP